MLRKLLAAATFATALIGSPAAAAGDFPEKPIRIIVLYTAGGASDIMAREVARHLTERVGQPVLVENKPGANGHIGLEAAARSAADGHTIVLGASPVVVSPAMFKSLPFDSIRDFAPITLVAKTPNVLVAGKDLPANDFKELLALSKAKPGTLTYASASPLFMLATELIKARSGLDALRVQYKGVVEGRTDVIAGRVSVMVDTVGAEMTAIRAGQVKPFAVLGSSRHPNLPEVPTLAESGLEGYDVQGWVGFLAPAGTPAEIIGKLNRSIGEVLQREDLRGKFSAMGFITQSSTPDELAELIKSDIALYKEAARQAGVEPQ